MEFTPNRIKQNTNDTPIKQEEAIIQVIKKENDIRNKITKLEKILHKDISQQIIQKYESIIETAQKSETIIKNLFPEKQNNYFEKIKNSLLLRSENLINKFLEQAEKNDEENKDFISSAIDSSYGHDKIMENWEYYGDYFLSRLKKQNQDLLNTLDRYNEEILLFAETYKSFKESKESIDIETIFSTDIRILSKEERKKQVDNLWAITKENRKAFITDPEEMVKREFRFRETLNNENVDFYSLEYNGNTVAFCSFEKQPDGSFLVESLNAESEVKGSKIGGDFFKVLVEKVRQNGPIYGYVHEKNAGTLPYYEKLGFKSEKVEKDGMPYFKIHLEKKVE